MDLIIQSISNASGLSEPFTTMVLKRLESFGYTVTQDDTWLIGFSMQKVENSIRNDCNVDEIPDGLMHIAVDMTVGAFLYAKKQSGRLTIGDLDFSSAVSSIKEGDTQVNFGSGGSDGEKLDALINYLLTYGRGEFACYRQIRW